MGRRAVYYTVSGGESGTDSEEDFELSPQQTIEEEDETDYQIVDEWDPSLDENQADIAEEEPESPLPSEEESASEEISGPMVGMGKKEAITFREGQCQRAFRGAIYCRTLLPQEKSVNLPAVLEALTAVLEKDFSKLLEEHHGLKGWVALKVLYKKGTSDEEVTLGLETTNKYITNQWEIKPTIDWISNDLLSKNSEVVRLKSSLQFQEVVSITIKVAKFNPIAGRSYRPLPPFLEKKRSIVNIKNTNEKCFGYCLAAYYLNEETGNNALEKKSACSRSKRKCFIKNGNRAALYDLHFEKYGLEKIDYPVDPHAVPALEDTLQIRINILSFYDEEGRARYPLYISKKKFDKEVDLLYWEGHYAWIRNFNGFLRDINKCQHSLFFCKQCFGHCWTKEALEKHKLYCNRPDWCNQIFILPEPGEKIFFRNTSNEQICPFVIYADCEALCRKTTIRAEASSLYEEQVACSVAYKLVSHVPDSKDNPLVLYTGEDCMERFMKHLIDIEQHCVDYFYHPPTRLSSDLAVREENEKLFKTSIRCSIC